MRLGGQGETPADFWKALATALWMVFAGYLFVLAMVGWQ